MKKIESFQVDHNKLKKGMYISRIDGDIITYDIRMKEPNKGDYVSNGALHTFEHLFATYARNSKFKGSVIYIGPMGCRTGFYMLLRDDISYKNAIDLAYNSFKFICKFEEEIPGAKEMECGNYMEHDLEGAKSIAEDMLAILKNWNEEKMIYEK